MATPNLNLETIEPTDNMKTSLLEKMNNNFKKIDTAYNQLSGMLLSKTGKNNLVEAIQYVDQLVNAQDATATSDKIIEGYTAYVGTEKITGTLPVADPIPTINVTLTGGYSSYISGYGAGIDQNGTLVIWAMSNTTSYEHITFSAKSLGAGTAEIGWGITGFDTSDPASLPHACTIAGTGGYKNIDITLDAYTNASGNDYILIYVTTVVS